MGDVLKLAIFTDYDGTITVQDTIDMMLDTFGAPDWLATSKRLDAAGATNIERMTAEFEDFHTTRDAVKALIRENVEIDTTFARLVEYAEERGWPLVVLSQGVRESVETIFEKYGIEGLEFHANRLGGEEGDLHIDFPERGTKFDDECSDCCGVCKSGHLRRARRQGFTTVYIGDGITDRCPAAVADVVFAKRYLKKYMTQKGLEFVPFTTFAEIRDCLARRFPAEEEVKAGE